MIEYMFSQSLEDKPNKIVDIGWMFINNEHSMIFDDPKSYRRSDPKPDSAKSVTICPATRDFDTRHFVITAPFDIKLKLGTNDKGQPILIMLENKESTIRHSHLNRMISISAKTEWRDPERPILQVQTPYLFVADEPVYINQLPPFMDRTNLPGLMIAGRFPIHVWPRPLMFAFEWHDIKEPLIIKRGDPWFYVRFETFDPSRAVRVQQSIMNPEIKTYIDSLSGVTNYVNRTYSLMGRAQSRRPVSLIHR